MANLSTAATLVFSEGAARRAALYRVIGMTTAADFFVVSTAFVSVNNAAQMVIGTGSTFSTGLVISGTSVYLNPLAGSGTIRDAYVFVWGNSA